MPRRDGTMYTLTATGCMYIHHVISCMSSMLVNQVYFIISGTSGADINKGACNSVNGEILIWRLF